MSSNENTTPSTGDNAAANTYTDKATGAAKFVTGAFGNVIGGA